MANEKSVLRSPVLPSGRTGNITGAARAALGQGLGMGWGDEAEAWLRERLGQGTYEDQLNKIRGEYSAYSKENPVTSGALEFAGGAAPGLAMLAVPGAQAAGVQQLGRSGMGALAKLGAIGAGTGAISGAGSAEEGSRISGGLGGGAIGGGLGVAVPTGMRASSAALKWLTERLLPTEARTASRAAEKLSQAASEGRMTPQEIASAMARDKSMNVPSVLANASPSLTDLAEAVAQRTGRGARNVEEALTKQKLGARERTYAQVQKNLHPGDYYADEQMLANDLRDKAKGLYSTAYAKGGVDDPVVNAILTHPTFQAAYKKGQRIASSEALAAKLRGEDPTPYLLPEIFKPSGKMDTITNSPIMELTGIPNVRTLDYVKRGLDDIIDSAYKGSSSVGKGEANSLKQLRNQFVSAIDRNVPEYRAARAAYAGDMEVIDAMRAGMNDFGKLDHEQVVKLVGGMSPSEKEAFRTGVARDLYGKIMTPSGNFNAAQRLIGSSEMQAKLQPLFDNPAQFELFKSALERESQLFGQANRVLGGSQTGKRMQMRENLEAEPGIGAAVGDALAGGFWGSLTGMATRAIRNTKMPEKTAEKLSELLMSKDPHEVAAVVRLLEEHATQAAPQAFKAGAAQVGATTGTTAAMWPTLDGKEPTPAIEDVAAPVMPSGPDIEADIQREAKP